MTIQEEFEEARLQNLVKQHKEVFNKINSITQEYGDYDVEVFLEVYNGLMEDLYKLQKNDKI